MGLGALADVSLADARDAAREARRLLRDGVDPIEARKARLAVARADSAKTITFQEASKQFIAAQQAGWKSAKHGDQWSATLERYCFPSIGDTRVADIDTGLVLKILEKDQFWETKPETASRVRGRVEAILDWARVRGFRSGDNPARWRGHLDAILPAKAKVKAVRHHPALPIDELPGFWRELRALQSSSARALAFLILTASRTSEVIGARWAEVDMKAKVWTVPGPRMKSGREHRVPLSSAAMTLLQVLPTEQGNPFVFIGAKEGRALSNMALLELMRGLRPESGFVPHGLRSTFRDWAGERTNFPRDLVEHALAHQVGDAVERAYRRGDGLERRRRLMDAWAGFAEHGSKARQNVVDMRSGSSA